MLWGTVETALDLQHAKRHTDAVRRSLGHRRGADLRHGQPAIQRDLDRVFASDLRRGQAIALSVALLVLVAVFGFLAVAIPFVFAACTIGAALVVSGLSPTSSRWSAT